MYIFHLNSIGKNIKKILPPIPMGEVEAKEVNITYETLFELMRREKMREDLQEISPSFFDDVLEYLIEKQKIFDETKHKMDLFSSQEREKTITQIKNIHRILRELYERREFKVLLMAVNKSRTGSSLINTDHMLREEILLFERLVSELSIFRTGILENILALRQPSLIDHELKQPTPISPSFDVPTVDAAPEPVIAEQPSQETTTDNQEPTINNQQPSKIKKVKILEDVPKFIGPELDSYGPYAKDQTIDIPPEIARLLINKGSAVEL